MDDALRPPTPAEVRMARARLGVTQAEFAKILGISRQGTISDWEVSPQRVVPSMSAARMEELVTAHSGVRVGGYVLDPRSYALGTLAAIRDDAKALASIVDALAAKVDTAERTLSGEAIPPSAVMDSSTQSGLDAVDALHGHPAPKRHKHR